MKKSTSVSRKNAASRTKVQISLICFYKIHSKVFFPLLLVTYQLPLCLCFCWLLRSRNTRQPAYLSRLSSPWLLLLLPFPSTNFLRPQLLPRGSAPTADSLGGGVTSHLTPASWRCLQPWTLRPRDGHSPRNSSFPVHLTWSRWTGPLP